MSAASAVFPVLRTRTPSAAPQTPATHASAARVARRPLIGGQLYLDALTVAGDRCECSQWCGRSHRGREGRCTLRHDGEAPLHVIPGDPRVDARRVVDVDQVLVVCRGCHDRRVTVEQDRQTGQAGQAGQIGQAVDGLGEW